MVICLERGAYCLHMVQLMPLHPETPLSLVSFKSRLVLLRRLYLSAALFQFFVFQPAFVVILHRLFLALYSHVSCCVCSWLYTVVCFCICVCTCVHLWVSSSRSMCPAASVPVFIQSPDGACYTCMHLYVCTCIHLYVCACTHLCVSSCRSTCCRMAACTSSVATKRTTPTSIRTLCTACRRWSVACSRSSIPR